MKKLLSILSVLTLTAIIPAPLLANTVQTRVKRDVGATAKDVTTGFNIKIKEKWEYWTKIDTNNSNWISNNEFSSNKNKWYIMFAIIKGESLLNLRAIKFKNDDINKPQSLSNQGNFIVWSGKQYWFNWLYRWYGVEEPNLPEIDKNGNILDWKLPKISDFQKGISFSLAENDKTATWSNAGMRLTVDGETNINIDNKNMEEVYWDGVKQPQTSKQWKINVKPETAPRDHKLVIKYDINGIKYTSEDITVSMLAKIDPPIPSKQENLSDVIKFGDENNLGNIVDNNDSTIFSAITQKNARIVDFSQITIEKKDNNSATLTAKPDSKSYKGSVDVKYNVVPATTVDLKIDVKPTAGTTQPDSDYLSQLDSSKMTNPVNTFYYASSESVITMVKQTPSSVITGVVYGCDEQWNKTSQSSNISPTNGIKLDGGQLGANNGKYLIELENELKQKNIIYLQIAPNQTKEHYFDTTNGKNFEIWANDNGYDNIRGYGASQLNKLFELSKTWKQSLAHLDLKLDNFVVDNIKNVIQDEIDNYKAKMLASVKVQVEKYIPNVVENTDYVISIDNFVAGDWTTSKDVKVQAVDGSTKLLSFTVKTIPIQEKTQPIPPAPDNKKDGDSKLWIIGVVVGVLAGLGLAYWLFKRFVFDKYFLPKIKKNRHNKLVEQVRKEEAEKDAQKK